MGVPRAMADGWAPSASIALHALALLAAVVFVTRPTLPEPGEKPIPVSLVTMSAPTPETPPAPQPQIIEPLATIAPPPVVSAAPEAPPAPPARKKPKPVLRQEPTPEVQPSQDVAVPRAESAPVESRATPAEPAGPSPSYLASIRQKLERNKVYPRAARQRRQQGTAILQFVVDRDGRVVSRRVEKSSGYAELDREVEAMLERAQPLPPMPPEMTEARLELVIPVDFHLR